MMTRAMLGCGAAAFLVLSGCGGQKLPADPRTFPEVPRTGGVVPAEPEEEEVPASGPGWELAVEGHWAVRGLDRMMDSPDLHVGQDGRFWVTWSEGQDVPNRTRDTGQGRVAVWDGSSLQGVGGSFGEDHALRTVISPLPGGTRARAALCERGQVHVYEWTNTEWKLVAAPEDGQCFLGTRPSLMSDGQDRTVLAWADGAGWIRVARLEQGKLELLPSVVPPSGWYDSPVLALDEQGHPTVAFIWGSGFPAGLIEVRSWNGQEWVAPEDGGVPAEGPARIAMVLDERARPCVAWDNGRGIYLATREAGTWSVVRVARSGSPFALARAPGAPVRFALESKLLEWTGQSWARRWSGTPLGWQDAALAIGADGSVVEVRAYLSGLDLAKLPAPLH